MAGHLSQPPDLEMLPPEERAAVARALAKAPDDRWPSCRDFVDAVRVGRVSSTVTPAWSPAPPASLPLPPSPSSHGPADRTARAAGDLAPDLVPLPKPKDPPATDRPEVFFLRLKELLRLHGQAASRGLRGRQAVLLGVILGLIGGALHIIALPSLDRSGALMSVKHFIGEDLFAGVLIAPMCLYVSLALILALRWYKRPQLRVARLIERIGRECPGQLREWGGVEVLKEATVVRDMLGQPDPGERDGTRSSVCGLVSPRRLPDAELEPLPDAELEPQVISGRYDSLYALPEITTPSPARPRGCLRPALGLAVIILGASLVSVLGTGGRRAPLPNGREGGGSQLPLRDEAQIHLGTGGRRVPLPNAREGGGSQQPPRDEAQIHLELGYEHLREKRFDDAISEYTAAIRIRGDDATAYNNRGFAYLMAGAPAMAAADCTKAIRYAGTRQVLRGKAYCIRSVAYELMNESAKAKADLRRALGIDQNLNKTWHETRNLAVPNSGAR
jgi:hypothetical protein